MSADTERQKVLDALESGKYTVEYEPVNTIYEYTKYDGSKFYVMEDLDGPRSSVDMGSITFVVETDEEWHEFIYDLNGGGWQGDELCYDGEVVEALEALDDFIDSEAYDFDRQCEVYARVYHLPEDVEIHWCENGGYPKDIESLGGEEVDVPLQYFIEMSHGASSEFMDMECTITDEDLYHIYKLAKKNGYLGDEAEDIELPGVEIEKECPELYQEIMERVETEAADSGYENENTFLKFILILSKDIFEENL